ncbi:MAG: hypothetical protein WC539_06890 [Nitrospirota bacterium]
MYAKKIILCLLLFSGFGYAEAVPQRPAHWATKIELSGVPNLYKITDNLYRSRQPSADGFKLLKQLGIKTVINLRTLHSDAKKIQDSGILNEELSVKTWHIEDEDVITVLRILRKHENGPFLDQIEPVLCQPCTEL